MIPGSNLLKLAGTVISLQSVTWYKFTGSVLNDIGLQVSQFAAGKTVKGSFQPVARSQFQALGLEFNKDYVSFYTSASFEDITRDIAGDQFVFAGDRYQVLSNTEWKSVDGWNNSIAVKLDP
jgi:hypothetical protein